VCDFSVVSATAACPSAHGIRMDGENSLLDLVYIVGIIALVVIVGLVGMGVEKL
jgi:hypothetical protein